MAVFTIHRFRNQATAVSVRFANTHLERSCSELRVNIALRRFASRFRRRVARSRTPLWSPRASAPTGCRCWRQVVHRRLPAAPDWWRWLRAAATRSSSRSETAGSRPDWSARLRSRWTSCSGSACAACRRSTVRPRPSGPLRDRRTAETLRRTRCSRRPYRRRPLAAASWTAARWRESPRWWRAGDTCRSDGRGPAARRIGPAPGCRAARSWCSGSGWGGRVGRTAGGCSASCVSPPRRCGASPRTAATPADCSPTPPPPGGRPPTRPAPPPSPPPPAPRPASRPPRPCPSRPPPSVPGWASRPGPRTASRSRSPPASSAPRLVAPPSSPLSDWLTSSPQSRAPWRSGGRPGWRHRRRRPSSGSFSTPASHLGFAEE